MVQNWGGPRKEVLVGKCSTDKSQFLGNTPQKLYYGSLWVEQQCHPQAVNRVFRFSLAGKLLPENISLDKSKGIRTFITIANIS